ncbi:MAG: M81 family metallopeptidase [SAR202 cluster bacterium]|nr:M81 family metallopeptidase [SAR202 cluster bacterium]
MRFAVLGISHETNTFSKVPADYKSFQVLRRSEMIEAHRTSNYTIAGYIQAAAEHGFELVPLAYAVTGPIGTITKDAYDRLTAEMFGMLKKEGPWDAVLISNHGAAVSAEYPDMDAAFTESVRKIVGPDVPVGITFDMHSNISRETIANTNVCVVWRTNPHLDCKLRGRKTAGLIYRAARREIKPVQWIEMTPMVVNIVKQFTGEEPMKTLVDDAIEANKLPGILDTSVAEGYPYSDVKEMGMSFIAVADGDINAAEKAARWMATRAWKHRAALNEEQPGVAEALKMANERYKGPKPLGVINPVPTDGSALQAAPKNTDHARLGPIVLMDVGDNIGGGSSADSTFILAEAQRMKIEGFLQSLYDPKAVQECVAAGVGAQVTLSVGAKTDEMHGKPVKVTGTVRTISQGKYAVTRPNHGGSTRGDCGVSVRLDTTDGHTLLLTSNRTGNTTREQMYHIGIWPEEYRIVVAKGVVSPRPAYQPIAAEIILVNTPGVTTADLSFFTYKHRRKPLFPFEKDAQYQ